jgi:hypothetical protein
LTQVKEKGMAEKVCKLAVVGIGTVGGEVVKGILRDADMIAEKTGVRLVVSHVVDKNEKRAAELGLKALLRPSLDTAVADPEVQIVVELVGGTTFAKTVIETATKAGKSVVTANKALLALTARNSSPWPGSMGPRYPSRRAAREVSRSSAPYRRSRHQQDRRAVRNRERHLQLHPHRDDEEGEELR